MDAIVIVTNASQQNNEEAQNIFHSIVDETTTTPTATTTAANLHVSHISANKSNSNDSNENVNFVDSSYSHYYGTTPTFRILVQFTVYIPSTRPVRTPVMPLPSAHRTAPAVRTVSFSPTMRICPSSNHSFICQLVSFSRSRRAAFCDRSI